MNFKILLLVTLIISSTVLGQSKKPSQEKIEIVIEGIRNLKGKIKIGFFQNDTQFQNENAYKRIVVSKANVINNRLVYTCYIESGTWGISLLDDENNNGKMEYSFFGIPIEGFGFSNYYLTGLSSPSFNDFKFKVISGQSKKVVVKMKYI